MRPATESDILSIAHIEKLCFPAAEAASLASFKSRFNAFPECFFVLEIDGVVVAHTNGCRFNQPALPDELFENATLHEPSGKYQTVFGLAVLPTYQSKGLATELMQHFVDVSKSRDLCGMFLTCKEHLIPFYQQFGFTNLGVSDSCHGGARWFDMRLDFL
ncbi:GNAT family N-acetyltransferase [Vibrio sp.]|nr:GNAT family N-acetyltransferase [Vibrio sp.]